MEPTDAELLARSKEGEVSAFTDLVLRYQSRVFAIAYANCHDRSVAEDACQDTFVIAWQQLGKLRKEEALGSWLCGIARNRTRALLRKTGRELQHEVSEQKADSTPLADLMEREASSSLGALVKRLPLRYREPLLLHYGGGESVAHIAESLSLSEAAVKKRLSRARDMLKEQSSRCAELAEACRVPAALAATVAILLKKNTAIASASASGGSIVGYLLKGLVMKKIAISIAAVALCVSVFVALRSDSSAVAPANAGAKAPLLRASQERAPAVAKSHTSLVGRVVDEEGRGIAGAKVYVDTKAGTQRQHALRGRTPEFVSADEDGNFSMRLLEGKTTIRAAAPGYLPSLPTAAVAVAGESNELTIRLRGGGVRVHGQVQDIGGGPVVGALLVANAEGASISERYGQQIAHSDAQGEFEFWVEPGTYDLRVQHMEYAPSETKLYVSPQELERDVKLVPAGSIRGSVLSATTKKPVPGAIVFSAREGEITPVAVSDEMGEFHLQRVPAGSVFLRASAERVASTEPVQIDLDIGEHRDQVELVLSEAYQVAGKVIDSEGRPVADAEVAIGDFGQTVELQTNNKTDSEGRFVIEGVPPGRYGIGAKHPDFAVAFSVNGAVVRDADVSGVEIRMPKSTRISGKVVPAAPGQVYVSTASGALGDVFGDMQLSLNASISHTRIGPDGTFTLPPLPVGKYLVHAAADDGRRGEILHHIEVGADPAVVSLQDTLTLEGEVRDDKGRLVVGMPLIITSEEHVPALTVAAHSDASGRISIPGLVPGKQRIEIRDPKCSRVFLGQAGDRLSNLQIIEIQGGTPTGTGEHHLGVSSCDKVVDGIVVDASGSPVADAWVTAYVDDEATAPVLSAEDGRFRIENLGDSEKIGLRAFHPSLGHGRANEISVDGLSTIRLAAGGSLALRVSGPKGKVSSFEAVVKGPVERAMMIGNQSSDAIGGLPSGEYSVRVVAEQGYAERRVEVIAGEKPQIVELELSPWLVVRGRLVDEHGGSVANAWITPIDTNLGGLVDSPQMSSFLSGRVQSDAQGYFELRRVHAQTEGLVTSSGGELGWISVSLTGQGNYQVEVDLGDVTAGPPPNRDE